MRSHWFEHVAKTRKTMLRTNKNTTHREAMGAASKTWPKQKEKLLKKQARLDRKAAKLAASGKDTKNKKSE